MLSGIASFELHIVLCFTAESPKKTSQSLVLARAWAANHWRLSGRSGARCHSSKAFMGWLEMEAP